MKESNSISKVRLGILNFIDQVYLINNNRVTSGKVEVGDGDVEALSYLEQSITLLRSAGIEPMLVNAESLEFGDVRAAAEKSGMSDEDYVNTRAHYDAIVHAYTNGHRKILILDDNILLANDFERMAAECMMLKEWDLFYLGFEKTGEQKPIRVTDSIYLGIDCAGSFAYGLSWKTIEWMAKYRTHKMTIRDWLSKYCAAKFMSTTFRSHKPLVIQDFDTIGGINEAMKKDWIVSYYKSRTNATDSVLHNTGNNE
jgi:GR25 family glycosyltransferase involved in LPS biosynthesis